MLDFNFFEPYIPKRNKLYKKTILIALISILILLAILYPVKKYSDIQNIKEEIISLNLLSASEENSPKKRHDIRFNNKRLENLEAEKNLLNEIKKKLFDKSLINDLLLESLYGSTHENIRLKKIIINNIEGEVVGQSLSKIGIAAYKENIQNSSIFDEVFILEIHKNKGNYDFIITFKIKEGSNDEIK